MEKSCRSGKIFVTGKYYEDVIYDVCSSVMRATFDGKGGITNYTVSNRNGSVVRNCYFSVFVNGEKLDPFCDKRVELVGRMQRILLKSGGTQIEICQFVAPGENAVFYEIKTNRPGDYEFVLDLTHTESGFHYDTNVENRFIDENQSIYLRTKRNAQLVLSYTSAIYCTQMLFRFSEFRKQVSDEFKSVKIPASAVTEKDKAFYVSSIFCALENYKEIGQFKGFAAGAHVSAPVRTYFRDSYWTVLCMYKSRPDLIRNQIVTLAHGVKENGDCPAGVTFAFASHNRSYYDSPSFFVMMVYDYINHTGDFSVLDEKIGGKTVYDLCFLAIDKLSEYEDKTGLVVKAGRYNKRDWADQINRTGYVTYVELLYARALYCLSRVAGTRDKARARRYRELFARTKAAINAILWDDEKGYYVNYRDGDFVEDNLSVDTVLAVLFGISDERQTERLLDNFSNLLESKNNRIRRLGDFGVMCVYPCYRGVDKCYSRSLQPYEFHNGAAWPYWSALLAYAQLSHGRDHTFALTSSFIWNLKAGNYTPVECYSPIRPDGAPLHARSSASAWVYDWQDGDFFRENEAVWGTK